MTLFRSHLFAPPFLAVACLAVAPLPAETYHPAPGITCRTETRLTPPQRLFIAEIDLSRPEIDLRVSRAGPDPDGKGPWETTLLPPTKIAEREHFAFVVNGDFFGIRPAKDGARGGYVTGIWANASGPAVSNGTVWSTTKSPTPCLIVRRDRSVRIAELTKPGPEIREAIAGNTILVRNAAAVPHKDKTRHPRTVVGLRNKGGRHLVVLVVDGRRPLVAHGMHYEELAAEMLRLGCETALNLDGGGSSVMAVREPGKPTMRTINFPTDGRERPVANVLGVTVKPPPTRR